MNPVNKQVSIKNECFRECRECSFENINPRDFPDKLLDSPDPRLNGAGNKRHERESAKWSYKPDSVQRRLAPAPWQPFL